MRPPLARLPYRRRSFWQTPAGALTLLLSALMAAALALGAAAWIVWSLAGWMVW